MYSIPYYVEPDAEVVLSFMKEYPFAIVTGFGDIFPVASHLPLNIEEVEGKLIFTGHMMKNTDHHKAFLQNNNVLVIFNGPHCYISASWYPSKAVASTWNYLTVHAKGKIHFGDEAQTRRMIEMITNTYECAESKAAFKELPDEYVNRMIKAIVGFSIEVENYEHVYKLSQNHDTGTRQIIITHLEERGDENSMAIAQEMSRQINSL